MVLKIHETIFSELKWCSPNKLICSQPRGYYGAIILHLNYQIILERVAFVYQILDMLIDSKKYGAAGGVGHFTIDEE